MLTGFSFSATATKDKSANAPEVSATEASLAYSEIPYLEEAFIDATPADRKDGILVGELGIDGGNKKKLIKLAQEIATNQHGIYDSLLIAQKGKLIFESYYSKGRVNLPHYQASATKAYTGLALGRAIQLGHLSMADLDKPLVNFLKGLDPSKFVKGAKKITLRDALTMRSGIRISDEQRNELRKIPTQLKGQGQVQALLERSVPITDDSQTFKYGWGPELVMQVIEVVVPGTAKDFIKKELLDKMGIVNYRWRTNGKTGQPESGWRTNMTSRAMLKFGLLARNKGQWQGEQLIPKAFIIQATSKLVDTSDQELHYGGKDVSNQCYGYFWWCADLKVGNENYFSSSAQGGNGQFITFVEELDLLIVHTASDNDASYLQTTAERILPAFIQNSIATKSDNNFTKDDFPILKGPYFGQKTPELNSEVFAPGIVSTNAWGDVGSFSPDMNKFYVSRWRVKNDKRETAELLYKRMGDKWHEVEVPDGFKRPFHSPDGKTLHFGKQYKERTVDGWSEMKKLGGDFEKIHLMGLSASRNNTLVLDEFTRDGSGLLRYSRLVDGKRETPKPLPKVINTGKWNAHPFIAPDESYILWDGERENGFGDNDIYISFRLEDGAWGEAMNLGNRVNTEAGEGGPQVTPDGKYLFFNRGVAKAPSKTEFQSDLFWIDAQIIETLRTKSQLNNKLTIAFSKE